jgi:antitoxin VapB
MGLNIKNPETYRLVKELAEATGLSMTAAVTEAVRARLDQVRADQAEPDLDIERATTLLRELRERMPPGYLDRDFDEMLYDEKGLPR